MNGPVFHPEYGFELGAPLFRVRPLELFVVYRNPSDFCGCGYVVRRWSVEPGCEPRPDERPLTVTTTLEGARSAIPSGKHNIGRLAADDPVIVEVWA